MVFRRKTKERVIEAKRATKVYDQYKDREEDVRNKLGISSSAPYEKIVFELNKIKGKRDLKRILHITDEDLERFGIV